MTAAIDTTVTFSNPSAEVTPADARAEQPVMRARSTSVASVESNDSVSSTPSASSSTSSNSLRLPRRTSYLGDGGSPPSPQTPQDEFVLAMHDFVPSATHATCLSFRAGQVIHVLNRDATGWWDGELEGRRGWFPSNYVNATSGHISPPAKKQRPTHHSNGSSARSSRSSARTTSVSTSQSHSSLAADDCPPIMVPIVHALALLHNAVRAKRVSHFQPSTACIISCVRSVLSATDCLSRDGPILKRYPMLAHQRKDVLAELAKLVAQARIASEDRGNSEDQKVMIQTSQMVYVHVRRFLAVALECGVELPARRTTVVESSAEEESDMDKRRRVAKTPTPPVDSGSSSSQRSPPYRGGSIRTAGGRRSPTKNRDLHTAAYRARSLVDLRKQRRAAEQAQQHQPSHTDDDSDASSAPLVRSRRERWPTANSATSNASTIYAGPGPSESSNDLYANGGLPSNLRRAQNGSVSSSSSSGSSNESYGQPVSPAFPTGPCSTAHVLAVLRSTHDHLLSIIAAFIGHVHSHTPTSHASSKGHLLEMTRETVDEVRHLLALVDAVCRHPDVYNNKPREVNLLSASRNALFNVTNTLVDSVRVLNSLPHGDERDEEAKDSALQAATSALRSGGECVTAVKLCLSRRMGEEPFIITLPEVEIDSSGGTHYVQDMYQQQPMADHLSYLEHKSITIGTLQEQYPLDTVSVNVPESIADEDEDVTVQPQGTETVPLISPISVSDVSVKSSSGEEASPGSPTDEESWDRPRTSGESASKASGLPKSLEEKIIHGELPAVPTDAPPAIDEVDRSWLHNDDFDSRDALYNPEGLLVGASLDALVAKMTPHDAMLDNEFLRVFFWTFRLFATPDELVDAIIKRYNIAPPEEVVTQEDHDVWMNRKARPVYFRILGFVKIWIDSYWRSDKDNVVLPRLHEFIQTNYQGSLSVQAVHILSVIKKRMDTAEPDQPTGGPLSLERAKTSERLQTIPGSPSDIPRPLLNKALMSSLRSKSYSSINITDFDALELARQLTLMESNLYCNVPAEEIIDLGRSGAKPPVNVRAITALSTAITGWVTESILDEHDSRKRTLLVKFFIKVADRCASLNNFSTPRSILAALDSSTISRLHQTWLNLPQKNRQQLESLRKLADHARNYAEYRSRLRSTVAPAVPFLGLYLTDVTFCREGNPAHRAVPGAPERKLINFNRYHKLARIIQDLQRFQAPYNLREVAEVQLYLHHALDGSKNTGDLQDLYRRSLMVEPRQTVDDIKQTKSDIFGWATRSPLTQAQP